VRVGGGKQLLHRRAVRTTYGGLDDLRPVLDDLSEKEAARTELSPYTPGD
jgi:hypothetical protein